MDNVDFLERLEPSQRKLFAGLTSPARIQALLNEIRYSDEDVNRCFPNVLRDGKAHCLDGGLLGAAAMRHLGYPPMIIDLLPEPGTDDDHVLVIFREHGRLGAIAKSNFVGLRYREPVYQTLRELVMAYFEDFFNLKGERTLRSYTAPLHLDKLDHLEWMWQDTGVEAIEQRLDKLRRFELLTPEMIAALTTKDELALKAGMLGTNYAGLFKPKI
jgi:hypothetical protein